MTMLTKIEIVAVLAGSVAGLYLLSAFAWSIAFPDRRIWPPENATMGIKFRVWFATIAIFGATFVLGITNWNSFDWPASVRWGVGLPLIFAANAIVWMGVRKIGFGATSGEVAELKTDGLYRYSRNPQYVADMVILLGWAVLSASGWAVYVAGIGVAVLTAAPLSEEPWLETNYGDQFRDYKTRVRRYL
ncbi:isoprenylcysteine carboxylmethyltransferase family protein [Sedimentitalea sp.]|uniref:methyltransferase family protein n=1 Tax=Sedimentitalea sp. TaxID=2048915 RepID=UPI003298FCEE